MHQLRHSHATELVNGGVSLPTIRKRLGHKNLQTTLLYAEQSDQEDLPLESISTPSRSVSQPGGKGLDPVTWGALGIIVIQAALPKLLEFLQAWSLRDQGRVIKAKIQKDGISIDVEYPLTLGLDDLRKHIQIKMGKIRRELAK